MEIKIEDLHLSGGSIFDMMETFGGAEGSDKDDIPPGANWLDEIDHALESASPLCFVVTLP